MLCFGQMILSYVTRSVRSNQSSSGCWSHGHLTCCIEESIVLKLAVNVLQNSNRSDAACAAIGSMKCHTKCVQLY